MSDVSSNSSITLSVNDLSTPLKRQGLAVWMKSYGLTI